MYLKLILPVVEVVVATLWIATALSVLSCDMGEIVMALTYLLQSGSGVVVALICLLIGYFLRGNL